MKKQRLKNNSFILIAFCVIALFVFTFNVTSSRYLGQIGSSIGDINAIPILNVENPNFEETLTNMLPGDSFESDFSVSNYDETNTNEVLMKYYIQISTDTIPLKITLTDEKGEIKLEKGKTTEEFLIYGEKDVKNYHIKVEWDKADNSYEYAGLDVKLTIHIVATQVIEGA